MCILREEPLHRIIDGSCIVKARGVLRKGKLRPESERERKARRETGVRPGTDR